MIKITLKRLEVLFECFKFSKQRLHLALSLLFTALLK